MNTQGEETKYRKHNNQNREQEENTEKIYRVDDDNRALNWHKINEEEYGDFFL